MLWIWKETLYRLYFVRLDNLYLARISYSFQSIFFYTFCNLQRSEIWRGNELKRNSKIYINVHRNFLLVVTQPLKLFSTFGHFFLIPSRFSFALRCGLSIPVCFDFDISYLPRQEACSEKTGSVSGKDRMRDWKNRKREGKPEAWMGKSFWA